MVQVSIIAQGLPIINLQEVAVLDGEIIVPTLDDRLLRVSSNGDVTTLANVSLYGIPFGIVEKNGNFLITVSGEELGDRLLRVTKSGFFFTVADLEPVCGSFGGPFGVAAGNDFVVVAIATDISNSQGCLIRVQHSHVSIFADTGSFGVPFTVIATHDGFIAGCETGQLLRVSLDGKVTPFLNLANAGFGIPFNLIQVGAKLIITSNTGNLLEVDESRKVSVIADLGALGFGIPSGVAVWDDGYVVTTNAGNLLRVTTKIS
ncbi:hypothetical protein DSM106972_070490 [Dulcicalothrix desertica PCC 7102]|uniref:Uncharacterized protein n=1 Tax=Dulcicalothrix desertica PCC 7102 TaxID=232991 RepID=A0A3S1C6B3_9CYAN|nr:hypothetical protein [Dulcicalothrix desertica]RUT01043.1 hypothetical protein DSM106972_070490 [Dulcicalothrix desertica PCC 7102]TWH39183.1 hypothetical protein CAL7102_08395 [Dulcicalothrix desertica PCC 7102]